MNKWLKATLWIVGIIVVSIVGLGALGLSMHSTAETFVTDKGLVGARVVDQSDKVLCASNAVGIIVSGKITPDSETKFYPICVEAFGEASLGVWSK